MGLNRKYLSKGLPYKTSKFMHDNYLDSKIMRQESNDLRFVDEFKQKERHRRVSELRYKEWLAVALKDGTAVIQDGELMITVQGKRE